jgi:hypothetical protein
MKGPRSRHKFNVQRVWECPQCKKRVFAPPQVVTRACECRGKDRPTWMCLIERAAGAASADAPCEP